jgi:hypothetical protein
MIVVLVGADEDEAVQGLILPQELCGSGCCASETSDRYTADWIV